MTTIGEAAALTGLTVRTLHHYDEIGLVRPSDRSEAGYRLYSRADLERLQEVLGWRALGFSLKEIGRMLDDPAHDRMSSLRRQRELVAAEADRLARLRAALDAAIDHEQEIEEMFEGFENPYADEAQERWGHTEAYQESERRTKSYGEREWQAIQAEAADINARFAALLRDGAAADGADAVALAHEHRAHIDRWFYPCSAEMHRGLGELYLADERFTRFWDDIEPGLARYVATAFAAASAS